MKTKAKAKATKASKASKATKAAKAKPKAATKAKAKAKAVTKKPKVIDGKSLVTRDSVIDMIKSIDKTKTPSTIYRYSLHYKGKDYCPRQVVRLIVEQFTDSELKHVGLRLANLIDHLLDLGFQVYDHKSEAEVEVEVEVDDETDETDEAENDDTMDLHAMANALQKLLLSGQKATFKRRR